MMTPLLRAGNYDAAVTVAVAQVARIVAQDAGVSLTGQVQAPRRGRGGFRGGGGFSSGGSGGFGGGSFGGGGASGSW